MGAISAICAAQMIANLKARRWTVLRGFVAHIQFSTFRTDAAVVRLPPAAAAGRVCNSGGVDPWDRQQVNIG